MLSKCGCASVPVAELVGVRLRECMHVKHVATIDVSELVRVRLRMHASKACQQLASKACQQHASKACQQLVCVRLRMRLGHIWPFLFFSRSRAHDVFGQGLGLF